MCKQVPVLRVIGFVFVVLAILAVTLGFFVPFWIRLPISDFDAMASASFSSSSLSTTEQPGMQNDDAAAGQAATPPTTTPVPSVGHHGGQQVDHNLGPAGPVVQAALTTTTAASAAGAGSGLTTGSEVDLSTSQGIVKSIADTFLANGTYLGLWAVCHQNLTCKCFAQNNFELELKFSDVHKAVQGIYGLGLLVLLIGLVIGSFHVCCCYCCRESYAIATVIGSFIAAGLILIFLALAIFAGFYAYVKQVEIVGEKVFEWGFYVPIGGIGAALIGAILFLVDGHRSSSESDADGEETAKMV